MGQILSLPETAKTSEHGGDKYLAYGLLCMQGWRISMEDAHATELLMKGAESAAPSLEEDVAFFGVYDGHGGEKAAIFAGQRLHQLVALTPAFAKGDFVTALKEGFLLCDEAILQDAETRNDESGCAATTAIITRRHVVCANAGDLRTVLLVDGHAKALLYDHKPFNEGEKARICAAGGYVDVGRVNGNLALLRGLGDFSFKKNLELPAEEQIVTCFPDVLVHTFDFAHDEFVILACDGIWDCLSLQTCVACVRRGVREGKPLEQICEELMELCCAPNSDGLGIGCDNMSVLIVALLDHLRGETLEQWYARVGAKDAPVLPPYADVYKEIFGEGHEMGNFAAPRQNYLMLGDMGLRDIDEGEEDDGEHAISLQKLLSNNVITNEKGVIYLDTSLAQLLLASFGAVDDKHIEEVEE